MELTGEQRIPVGRQQVWEALNDPEILRQSIPGCESVEKTSDTEFTAVVTAKVGPVKAKFKGNVVLSDIDAPNGYTISGKGTGGAAGFGKGQAKVRLEDDGDGTILRYEASASVGGKLAQVGSRIVDSVARKMADEFFTRFNEIVSERAGVVPSAAELELPETVKEEIEAEAMEALAEKASSFNPVLWGSALIAIVVIVLYFASR